MAQIINFPGKQKSGSAGYDNLARLIAIAATADILNFYMDSIEEMENKGYLLDGEARRLEEQGRAKRLEIAKPEQKEPEKVTGAGTYSYCPEMGEQKPDCKMEAQLSYYGKHYFVDSPVELKGRGITLVKRYTEKDFCKPGNYRLGWYEYQVTKLAFEKLKEEYSISMERLLD